MTNGPGQDWLIEYTGKPAEHWQANERGKSEQKLGGAARVMLKNITRSAQQIDTILLPLLLMRYSISLFRQSTITDS